MIDILEYMKLSLEERQKHINQNDPCIERGGMSTYFKGMMAHILDTTIPEGMNILICHYCGNSKCSNPNHLYFGTPKENVADGIRHGTMKSPWENTIIKYGHDKTTELIKHHQLKVCGKDTYYITDGRITKRISKNLEIPQGFRKGRK